MLKSAAAENSKREVSGGPMVFQIEQSGKLFYLEYQQA
jgi:hypothetical protein